MFHISSGFRISTVDDFFSCKNERKSHEISSLVPLNLKQIRLYIDFLKLMDSLSDLREIFGEYLEISKLCLMIFQRCFGNF